MWSMHASQLEHMEMRNTQPSSHAMRNSEVNFDEIEQDVHINTSLSVDHVTVIHKFC